MSTVITDKELGRGLDAYHPETKLSEGFVPYIENMAPTHSGSLKLRTGYQRVGGYMPVRVLSATKAPGSAELVMKIDPGIKLRVTAAPEDTVSPFPVVIYSRLYKSTSTPPNEIQEAPASRWYATCRVTDVDQLTVTLGDTSGTLTTYAPGSVPTNDPAVADVDMWLWGLPLDETYGDGDVDRTLWLPSLSGLDTQTEDTIVAAFNGQLMRLSNVSTYGELFNMPATSAGVIRHVAEDVVLGPAFHNATPSPMRTRGAVVTGAAFPDNYLDVSSVTYDPNTGLTTYLLKATGRTVTGSPVQVGDILTVEQCSWSVLDGRHEVVEDATYPTDAVSVVVRNVANALPNARISDLTGGRARAAIQSDRLETGPTATPLFTGDVVQFGDSTEIDGYVVTKSDLNATLYLDVITELRSILQFDGIYQSRTSRILVPDEITGFVRGDVIYTPTLSRGLTVRTVWAFPSTDVVASCSGLNATVQLPNSAPYIEAVKQFRIGDCIQLVGGSALDGAHEITDVDTTTRTLTFSSTAIGVTTSTLVGNYIAIDEPWLYQATDPTVVSDRWSPMQPAEIMKRQDIGRLFDVQPVTAGLGTLDGSTIPIPSVIQSRERLYLSNGEDPVLTTNGQTYNAAGHFLTAPTVAIDVTTNHPNPIQNPYTLSDGVAISATTAQTLTIATSDKNKFSVGDYVTICDATSYGGGDFMFHSRVLSIETVTATPLLTIVTLTAPIPVRPPGKTPVLTRLYKTVSLRYTMQWVALDENGNVAASLCPQVKDNVVAFGPPSVVNFHISGYPTLTTTRYTTLELRIYRAGGGLVDGVNLPAGQQSDWTWIASVPYSYLSEDAYSNGASVVPQAVTSAFTTYTDNAQVGAVASAFPLPLDITSGNNMGENWEMPPRGRSMAVASNVLAVGNYVGWPEHNITFRSLSEATSRDLDGTRFIFRRSLSEAGASPGSINLTTSNFGTQTYRVTRVVPPLQGLTTSTDNYTQWSLAYLDGSYASGTAGTSYLAISNTNRDNSAISFLQPKQGMWAAIGRHIDIGYTESNEMISTGWHQILADGVREDVAVTFPVDGQMVLTYTQGTTSRVPAVVGMLKSQIPGVVCGVEGGVGGSMRTIVVTSLISESAGPVVSVTFGVQNSAGAPMPAGTPYSIPTYLLYMPSPKQRLLKGKVSVLGPTILQAGELHNLSVGQGVIYSSLTQFGTSAAPDIVPGTQLYVRPRETDSYTLHRSISDAINNVGAISLSGTVNVDTYTFTVATVHAAATTTTSAPQFGNIRMYLPSTPGDVDNLRDIILPVGDSSFYPPADNRIYTRTSGQYTASVDAPRTSTLIQLAVTQLSRAINAVSSGSQEQMFAPSGANIIATTTPVNRQTWLTSDVGSLYSPGTVKVRSTEPFTVQIIGSYVNGGRQKFQFLVGKGTPYKTVCISQTFKFINATGQPARFVAPNHGLVTGLPVVVRSANEASPGSLPVGISPEGLYYVVVRNANTFALASSEQNAIDGVVLSTYLASETPASSLLLEGIEPSHIPVHKSRISLSYPNYPEVHAGSYDDVPAADNRVVDVNPDDGEEIETLYPFYGDSFSKASLQEDRLVVFKRSNVYLVNVNTREVTRVQTYGHGAEFPRTVTDTRNGLMFADRTGIYKLNRSSDIPFIGEYLGRIWDDDTGVADVDTKVPVAVHDAFHNQVRVSVPTYRSASNDLTFTYDHKRESGDERGAWTTWTGYDPVSWLNFQGNIYHGGRHGITYVDRSSGDATDHRDDDRAISATVQLRPSDFGVSGSRKNLARVVVQFRRSDDADITGISVSAATDMERYFIPCDPFTLRYNPMNTGIAGDRTSPVIYSISFSVPVRKAEFHQVQIAVAVKDQPVEITQITYHVDLLTSAGTPEAGET